MDGEQNQSDGGQQESSSPAVSGDAAPTPSTQDHEQQTPASGSSAKPMNEQWAAIAAGAAAVIGAFMPWMSANSVFGELSRNGVDDGGDGLLTAGAGVLGALAAWQLGKWLWVTVVGGLAIAAIGVYDYFNVKDRVDSVNNDPDMPAVASVGSGMYLTIAAGVVMFAAGAIIWNKSRQARGAAGPETA